MLNCTNHVFFFGHRVMGNRRCEECMQADMLFSLIGTRQGYPCVGFCEGAQLLCTGAWPNIIEILMCIEDHGTTRPGSLNFLTRVKSSICSIFMHALSERVMASLLGVPWQSSRQMMVEMNVGWAEGAKDTGDVSLWTCDAALLSSLLPHAFWTAPCSCHRLWTCFS